MVFPNLVRYLKWISRSNRQAGARRRLLPARRGCRSPRSLLWLEALEDRTVLSRLMVTSAADDGTAGTLRAVLAGANSGDTIQFAHQLIGQTISLVQGQLPVNQSVAIHGPGSGQLTISGSAASRIFAVASGTTVTISGLTLTQGLATDGAAILNAGNLTVSQDAFNANVAQGAVGGGLFGDEAGRGGGIENQAGATLAVSQSTFSNNQAVGGPDGGDAFGGAIYNEAGTLTVAGSTFTNNQAVAALLSQRGISGAPATLQGTFSITLLDVAGGGGIWNDGGSLTVSNSGFSTNQAEGVSSVSFGATFIGSALGGAIGTGAFFTGATPSLTLNSSTLSGNVALAAATAYDFFGFPFYFPAGIGRGGAVEAFAGNITVSRSTLSGNIAESGTAAEQGAKSLGAGLGAAGGGIDDEVNLRDFAAPLPSPLPTLAIGNSSLGNNQAVNNAPGAGNVLAATASGGALTAFFVNSQLTHSTVSGNQALGSPGTNASYYVYGGYTANGGYATGAAIDSFFGSLTISGSSVNNNVCHAGSGGKTGGFGGGFAGGQANGGGIYSSSQAFTLANSTLSGNQSLGGDDTAYAQRSIVTGSSYAGGLYMSFDAPSYGGSATVSGTTFSNNLSRGGATFSGGYGFAPNAFGAAVGGGANALLSSLQMSNCTFSGNQAQGGAAQGGRTGGPGVAGGLFSFQSNFTINNTAFVGNQAQGGVGSDNSTFTAGAGGYSWGGALVNDSSPTTATPTLSNCNFLKNSSTGGAGGGGLPGTGGSGVGGAVLLVDASTTTLSNCNFVSNQALGGTGGTGDPGNAGGAGGAAAGGALANQSDGVAMTTTMSGCSFAQNEALGGLGGNGGSGANGGTGGNAQGGAAFNVLVNSGSTAVTISLTVNSSALVGNQAVGGAGGAAGAGGLGGSGGNGQGGGFFDSISGPGQALLTIDVCAATANAADGGAGASGGNGGNGDGGGLFIDANATATVLTSVIAGNLAEGGAGSTAGQGVGGGVYNLGTFYLDSASIIAGNHASTSNDNVYGTITPI
jgi:hypothetical protein